MPAANLAYLPSDDHPDAPRPDRVGFRAKLPGQRFVASREMACSLLLRRTLFYL